MTKGVARRAVGIAVPVLALSLGLLATAPAVAATAANAAGADAAPVALTAKQAADLSTDVTDKVIVVMRDQEAALPDTRSDAAARVSAVSSDQKTVIAQLHQTDATSVKSLSLINAVTATVSPGEAKELSANPAVEEVVKDEAIPLASSSAVNTLTAASPDAASYKALAAACPSGKGVQLDPQAIETIHAATQSGTGDSAHALGYTGAGVKVAFIADGLNIDDPDFVRADGKKVFVDYQDFSGTGTNAPTDGGEAFLDASSIAAQGREVYNLDNYDSGLTTPCRIRIEGVAPGASLVGLNVFGASNVAYNSVFLEAINYAVNTDHVQVINESFGSNPFPDTASLDLTKMADDAAVAAGVTVTVSTGDAGGTDTIGSPATDPNVISAGASTTYRAYAQGDVGGITTPGVTGWVNNNISGLSSGGFAEDGSTVDIVAPGDLNWALCSPHPAKYSACVGETDKPASVELTGGTSEAAPLTAGTAALVIQAYAEHHGGTDPTPAVVKQIIVSTAEDIKAPGDLQGAGMLDAYKAVLAAASYPGGTSTATGAVYDATTQFNAVAAASTPQTFSETLTNDGSAPAAVTLSSRTLSAYTTVLAKSLTLEKSDDYSAAVTFTVPAGQARLDASMATVGAVNVSLINPRGQLANYSLPQGIGNFGDAEVASPAAGTWTALVQNAAATTASVVAQFQASTATWQSFGSLSASSLTIPGGGSESFSLTVPNPASPGDQAGSIVVTTAGEPSFAATSTIPVTLRTLIPTPTSAAPSVSFTGTLTGGNGRQPSTGQTAYYQMQVPAGLAALNADISTADSSNTFAAQLVSPSGQATSTAANSLLKTTARGDSLLVAEDGTQLHVLAPAAGLWTLVIDFYNTVSGTATSQPFDVTINDVPVTASATGLPDSTATTLPAGTPVTVDVSVTNSGDSPETYFTDARLNTTTTLDLTAKTQADLALPDVNGVVPVYLVPSHTSAINATVSTPKPVLFDMTAGLGDPDVISTTPFTATTATASFDQAPVTDGEWTITPFLTGPTGDTAFKTVTADTSMTATTQAFDPAVSSPTGDLWETGVGLARAFDPYVVDPGQTATIPVTITPSAAAGTVVSGTLYLDDAWELNGDLSFNDVSGLIPEASDVAAFPYTYTVGG